MLPCDERRFKPVDLDGDQTATREEFTAFLHPEEFEHMKEIVVLVRYRKSLCWQKTRTKAARKPCPFLQSENVLQPEGDGTRTLKWNTPEYLCTQEISQGRVAAVASSPQSQPFNTIKGYIQSRQMVPVRGISWAVLLQCCQAPSLLPSCPPPSCGFEVILATTSW